MIARTPPWKTVFRKIDRLISFEVTILREQSIHHIGVDSCGKFATHIVTIPHGLVARILGFHPGGPGSIPGAGVFFFFFLFSLTCS